MPGRYLASDCDPMHYIEFTHARCSLTRWVGMCGTTDRHCVAINDDDTTIIIELFASMVYVTLYI